MISARARDLIVEAEVSSKKTYEAKYRRPEWPGGASGVTIGIGYDLGMASRDKITRDWQAHVPAAMLKAMQSCAGVSGSAAKSLCARVRSQILIEWDLAIQIFDEVDTPEWEAQVVRKISKAADLNADCLGVLVSLAYNRGASFDKSGDRYREMRAIKADIQNDELDDVAAQLRSMKRLWPDMRGLRDRREAEASLWEDGLQQAEVAEAAPARANTGDDKSDSGNDTMTAVGIVSSVGDAVGTGAVIVEKIKPITKSKISWGAVGLGATSTAAAAVNAPPTLFEQFINIWKSPIWWLMLLNLLLVGWILWHYYFDHGMGLLRKEQK